MSVDALVSRGHARLRQARRWLAVLALSATSSLSAAQGLIDSADWVEGEAPPPPALQLDALIPFQVSVHASLRYGVDPASVSVGTDGVIRYVMVARSDSGALNAWYEGLRCASAEVKTYARWRPGNPGSWGLVQAPEWRELVGHHASRAALVLARNGFCQGNTPNSPPSRMLRELRQGKPYN